ncbi:MAG TPA: hypothetical protein VIJ85_05385 [Rhizomicrobium sp.]
MTSDKLDALLAAPLRQVDDAGFSSHVVVRVLIAWERAETIETICWLALAAVVLAFMPLGPLVQAMEKFSMAASMSIPLALVVLGLVLTALFARTASD